jgi:hypothetical protein
MTDIVQAREAAIAAETNVENLFNRVLDRLHACNARLLELHDEIKAAQPVASGAVCLELYRCGAGCNGCPHPRWVQYTWTAGTTDKAGILMGTNLDAQDREPILALKRKSDHYRKTANLIREAKSILVERSQLLTNVRALRYVAKET